MAGLDDFINELPTHLRMAVSLAIHDKVFKYHPLMKRVKNKRLLSYLGQKLRPQFNHIGTSIYKEGDEITNMLIVTSGVACFIAPKFNNQLFAVVSGYSNNAAKYNNTLHHFGYEDSVVNHLLLIKDIE